MHLTATTSCSRKIDCGKTKIKLTYVQEATKMSRLRIFLIPLVASSLLAAVALRATTQQEHPKQEHPRGAKPISTKTLEKTIKEQITEKAKASGGRFPVEDPVLKKTWQLEL